MNRCYKDSVVGLMPSFEKGHSQQNYMNYIQAARTVPVSTNTPGARRMGSSRIAPKSLASVAWRKH